MWWNSIFLFIYSKKLINKRLKSIGNTCASDISIPPPPPLPSPEKQKKYFHFLINKLLPYKLCILLHLFFSLDSVGMPFSKLCLFQYIRIVLIFVSEIRVFHSSGRYSKSINIIVCWSFLSQQLLNNRFCLSFKFALCR